MLGKIWDLADQDKDGALDRWEGMEQEVAEEVEADIRSLWFRYEFTVSMHLVYRALQGDEIPDQVPEAGVPEGGGAGIISLLPAVTW